MTIDAKLTGADTLKIRWRDARFTDSAVEADYLVFSWASERFQSGLTLVGFSLAWLAATVIDLMYLSGTPLLLPIFGSRLVTGLFGVVAGGWLLLARPGLATPWPRRAISAWLMMSTATGLIVSSLYPHTTVTPHELEQMLVFNSFWMSTQILGLGVALAARVGGIAIAASAYAIGYVVTVVSWAEQATYPIIGPSIVLLSACIFALVLSVAFSVSARRRYYLTWKYNEARNAAERAQNFSSFLLSAAGHDIRQPIYALDLNAAAIEDLADAGRWERVKAMIAQQRLALRQVSSLIASILELSNLDLHNQDASRDVIDLEPFLEGVAASFAGLALHQKVRVRVVPTRMRAVADRAVLEHVINNLVANALTHSGGTRVVMGVRRRGDGIAVCVADNGSGFRVDAKSSDSEAPGKDTHRSGLGTAIMYRLAELGGLDLDVRSTPGKGVIACVTCRGE